MNIIIEHNRSIDLINGIVKYVQYCISKRDRSISNNTPPNDLLDFSPSKQIKSWLKYVDSKISPFLKNDLLLLVEKMVVFPDTCVDITVKRQIEAPKDLIKTLEEIPAEELARTTYKYYRSDVGYDEDYKLIADSLCKLYDDDVSNTFIQIKRYPAEYKSKVINLLSKFNEEFIEPNECYVSNFIKEKLHLHNSMLKNDPVGFLNAIGIGDYKKALEDSLSTRIFISYYVDLGFYYFKIDDLFYIQYGFYMEERLNNQILKDKYKNLFKALSDERRLDIIRLTSRRPWYNKELADYFGLTTATLSYHLNLLLDLGILNFEPSDNNRYYYTTNKEALRGMFDLYIEELISISS